MWKTLSIGVILIIAGSFPATAQNCHLGAQAGLSFGTAAISQPSSANLDGLGLRSRYPDMGIHAGCDVRMAGSPFVLGLFGDYTWRNTEFSASAGPFAFTAALSNSWTVGGRAGYALTNGAMPYALLGYTTTDVSYSATVAGMPTTLHGWTYGGGIEIPMAPNLKLATEIRSTSYASTDLFSGLATLKTNDLSGMVRLSFSFGDGAIPGLK